MISMDMIYAIRSSWGNDGRQRPDSAGRAGHSSGGPAVFIEMVSCAVPAPSQEANGYCAAR